MLRNFLIIWVACLLSGCAALSGGSAGKAPPPSERAITISQGVSLPEPQLADFTVGERPYHIGPFDKLMVDVFGLPEFTREIQADAGGKIAFPLIGTLDATGKTPSELSAMIEQGLRRAHVRNPEVTVNIKEVASKFVTVDGEVQQPGVYPVTGKMSLIKAVATARGVSENAKLDDVVVFRTVGGKKMAALYNLKSIRKGYYEDPELFANDVVIVGDSPARRIFRDALQIVPTLTYVLVALLK